MLAKVLLLIMCFGVFGPLVGQTTDTIALLFLTNRHPNHPRMWQKLLKKSKDKYSVYIHSKNKIDDLYFQKYRIAKTVPTSWSIHVRAWHVLLQEGLKDPNNKWFAFLSDSCIPLYTLDYIYDIISSDGRSHIAYAGPWWPEYFPREIAELLPEYRFGNSEWMVLSREHAEIVANDRSILKVVSQHANDQESYFGCLFAVQGILHELCNHSYTFVDWAHPEGNGAHPHTFHEQNELNDQLLNKAYAEGALFARKFSSSYPEHLLVDMIKKRSQSAQREQSK